MSVENLQIVYKPLLLVTPREAETMGIKADGPTLIGQDRRAALFNPPYLVYQAGAVVEAPEDRKNIGFVDMKTGVVYESHGYFARKPYTGFIAVGEVIGDHKIEALRQYPGGGICVNFQRILVKEIKAFFEESEVKQGHVIEVVNAFLFTSQLIIDHPKGLTKGRGYNFGISDNGEVVFTKPVLSLM